MRSGVRNGFLAAAIVAAAAGVGGCELTDSGTNLVNGKQLFAEECASCHVLARADAQGVIGPNLDQAFQRARQDGFGESTFAGIVEQQIANPAINPQRDPETGREASMPADIVTGEDAEDVAAYVASAAARGGEDTGALAQIGGGAEGTAEAEGGVLEIPATGALFYQFADATAQAGGLTIRSPNEASVEHNIALEGAGVDEVGEVVPEGEVSEIDVDVEAGEYTFYCSVEGHREGGMEGTLTVE